MPKNDLTFASPLMNAAGCLGFAPDARAGIDLARLGLFITNPISLKARAPAHGGRFLSYPGGFLLHTGHPNPGFREVIKRNAAHWARASLQVVVHLLAETPDDLYLMARRLEALENVAGIEVGFPPEASAQQAIECIRAAGGELPVIARLPFERALELGRALAAEVQSGEARASDLAALSLSAPRGVLPDAGGRLMSGRLYGPSVFPAALALVQQLARCGLPVFAAGGVYSQGQTQAMLSAGAAGVQLDVALWCAFKGFPVTPLGQFLI